MQFEHHYRFISKCIYVIRINTIDKSNTGICEFTQRFFIRHRQSKFTFLCSQVDIFNYWIGHCYFILTVIFNNTKFSIIIAQMVKLFSSTASAATLYMKAKKSRKFLPTAKP